MVLLNNLSLCHFLTYLHDILSGMSLYRRFEVGERVLKLCTRRALKKPHSLV